MDTNSPTWLGVPVSTVVTAIVSVVVGLIAISAPTLTFWWTNLRRPAKQTAVLDFATKRVAFWDQVRKAKFAAVGSDHIKRDEIRKEVLRNIDQTVNDANQEMKGLSWSGRRKQFVHQQWDQRKWRFMLTWKPQRPLPKNFDSSNWYVCMFCTWFCFIMYFFGIVSLIYRYSDLLRNKPVLVPVLLMLFVMLFLARKARVEAEKLQYSPQPEEVVTDRI